MDRQDYLLEINKDCSYESEVFRISKGSSVSFSPGSSLFGYNVQIFTNVPVSSNEAFQRNIYRKLGAVEVKNGVRFEKVKFATAGSYHFYFTVDNVRCGEGYISVDPELILSSTVVPLNSLRCLTVISKCLGKFSTWRDKLSVASSTYYNVIHFTPIQKLGASNSAYSLCDQLSLNPIFNDAGEELSFEQVKQFLNAMRDESKMLSVCDIVLNHSANETEWLWSHPECGYNLVNSNHLRPAYLLDLLLATFSRDIANNVYSHRGLTPQIHSEQHIQALRHILWTDVLSPARIPHMFMVDVNRLVAKFQSDCLKAQPSADDAAPSRPDTDDLVIIQDPLYRRLQSTVSISCALRTFNIYRKDCFDEDSRVKKCTEKFKEKLEELNRLEESRVNGHLEAAVNNVVATVAYFRVQPDGPRISEVSLKDPLVTRYFVEKQDELDDAMGAVWSEGESALHVMAHNGWVMNDDPLRDFASPTSNVYLRRELIAWGDSIKLRYGEGPTDCPYLWDKMKSYVEMTADLFHGVRLDNCHSTPIHVAQYLLDAGRKVNPNLYVVAELFTNSASTDNIFVNKLGITSLIRESMSAWDSHELGRLVYRYGGRPVGSLLGAADDDDGCATTKLTAGVAHALFFDLTHDNPSPVEKRSPYDLLPSAALVAMASTAVGSNYGYDHLVPHHIDVVKENREYMGSKQACELNCHGIVKAKAYLNSLHSWLTHNHFDEVFVDQLSKDVVCVTRHNRLTLESFLMFSYTAFSDPATDSSAAGGAAGLFISVTASDAVVAAQAYLRHRSAQRLSAIKEFEKNDRFINGLSEYELILIEYPTKEYKEKLILIEKEENKLRLSLTSSFLPGSIVTVRLFPSEEARSSADLLNETVNYEKCLQGSLKDVDLVDANHILYKSGEEEPGGTYNVPGYGNLVYAGLQGIMSIGEEICKKDDQGHPVCCNLREGLWLSHYTTSRLLLHSPSSPLGKVLKERLDLLEFLPPGMRPYYFFLIISKTYFAVRQHIFSKMSPFVKEGSDVVRALSLSSLQFVGSVDSATLPPLSAWLSPSPPRHPLPTIAAGLPHFSVGYMRSWGRDTFISVRGLLLLTGRFQEARWLILGYGACVRHGLLPNLLSSGITPRYNCRDAVWWWLQTIKEYSTLSSSNSILDDPVSWLFPNDSPSDSPKEVPLDELVLHCLQVHFQGLCFREHNAGKQIDEHMTSQGFDNQIGVHPHTGFVFGGNEWNCGTWMDKMGSSSKAGTKGRPATPRDGSAVELVGLSYSIISWLDRLCQQQVFPHKSVTRIDSQGEKTSWTWSQWAEKIRDNFESEFWIGSNDKGPYVNKRNIYKDSVGAHQPWEDYRLRPNFLVALSVAPELFDSCHARKALKAVESKLVGPLGIKTLDPDDLWYIADYDNSNDTDDAKVAQGFNYHQGPEWVWLMGYYLRGSLRYESDAAPLRRKLSTIWSHLTTSPWRGLPELTNSDGSFCSHSCHTQAWSVATILEALYDMEVIKND